MMRWLCALVFALAAGSSVVASSGLTVPPHVDAPGAPRVHDHVFAGNPDPQLVLGGLVLATLVLLIPRLPSPTRRAVAVLTAPGIRPAQWRLGAPFGPPRLSLLAIA